jgi:hypothetical protein
MNDGGVSRVNNQGNIGQLLYGQNHFDNVDINAIRNLTRNQHVRNGEILPRDKMLARVQDWGLTQPMPKCWMKQL